MWDKVLGWGQLIFSQIPGLVAIFIDRRWSLYQPGIYKGYEAFLLLPFFVAVVSTWSVRVYKRKAMWGLVPAFALIFCTVYWIFRNVDITNPIHTLNWALSYCLVALLFASFYGLVAGP
ncbi:hypothetical protein [Rhizobium sp. WYJ-E13]|uniref:hypothetical protein n=1 Tax=Rhizobium sp. WYJ-E13 TaxID=2849093 RepID=UPI001C1EC7FD|nr:hypothetical protein [Rhizobium sp. WYJ-E13]QWW72055.1 hypothetical protein KQ933_25985 [Rhizobium sp. WYJ-E13]